MNKIQKQDFNKVYIMIRFSTRVVVLKLNELGNTI